MSTSKLLWAGVAGACTLFCTPVFAERVAQTDQTAVVRQGTPHQALFAVAFEGNEGVAVGAAGELLTSHDAGNTWLSLEAPTHASLLGVALRGGRAVAVGQSGVVLLRDAAGKWITAECGTKERLFGVDLDERGSVVVVGAFGRILRSGDGGTAWTSISPDWTQGYTEQGLEPHLYDVALTNDGSMLVVGEFGLVIQSTDHGVTWKIRRKGEASLFALDVGTDGVGYAVGQGGMISRTVDGGMTWSDMVSGSTANLLDVRRMPNGHVVVTAMRDMFESDDGTTWRRIVWGDFWSGWYAGVAYTTSDHGTQPVVVGHAGRIVKLDH